jgi:hypothetical protein
MRALVGSLSPWILARPAYTSAPEYREPVVHHEPRIGVREGLLSSGPMGGMVKVQAASSSRRRRTGTRR